MSRKGGHASGLSLPSRETKLKLAHYRREICCVLASVPQ